MGQDSGVLLRRLGEVEKGGSPSHLYSQQPFCYIESVPFEDLVFVLPTAGGEVPGLPRTLSL